MAREKLPSADGQEWPAFLQYLNTVKSSQELAKLQLSASESSMERCRQTMEWQQSVHAHSIHLLALTTAVLNSLDAPVPRGQLGNYDAASAALRASLVEKAIRIDRAAKVICTAQSGMSGALRQLAAVVLDIEKLVVVLAQQNEDLESCRQELVQIAQTPQ